MERPRLLIKIKPDDLIQTNLSWERVEWVGIDETRLAMATGKRGSLYYVLEIFHNKKFLKNLNRAPLPCVKSQVPSKPGSCRLQGLFESNGCRTLGNCLSLALGPGKPS